MRLDVELDRDALTATVAELRPKLLVLDPFVRLHRIDESLSGEVAPLLAYLREIQRRFHVAVVLVHHARKGGAKMRAGYALRGSSEFLVATGELGYQIHRRHRYPGTHPVTRGRFFASTVPRWHAHELKFAVRTEQSRA